MPLVPHVAGTEYLKISYYRYKLEYLVVSGHVMATYLKWHVCPMTGTHNFPFVQILLAG